MCNSGSHPLLRGMWVLESSLVSLPRGLPVEMIVQRALLSSELK